MKGADMKIKKKELQTWGWKHGLKLREVAPIIGVPVTVIYAVNLGLRTLPPERVKEIRKKMSHYRRTRGAKP